MWVTDGTATGTRLLADIYPGRTSGVQASASVIGEYAYFIADSPAYGREVWRTDGTPEGTRIVTDLAPGTTSGVTGFSFPATAAAGGYYYFPGSAAGRSGMWRTDGSAEGTTLAIPGDDSLTLYPVGNRVIFDPNTPSQGREWWVSDGTGGAPTLL
jgi:ELWxxDGT repeat protein